MTPAELRTLLDDVGHGRIKTEDAHTKLLVELRSQPFEDLGFARVDHHRDIRQGFPEVILGLGKTPDQIARIAAEIVGRNHPLLVTRADQPAWLEVSKHVAEAEYHELARCITVKGDIAQGKGTIVLCSAGTSDQTVAEEAAVT